MSQNDMPVFCDVSAEEQIEALRGLFKSKGANLNESHSTSNANEINESNLGDLIKNLDCLYSLAETNENDLEMVLNSLLSLIIISPDTERMSKLVTTFCESILKAQLQNSAANVVSADDVLSPTSKFGFVKLRVLSNLFHGLTWSSKHRYTVFVFLIKCSIVHKNLQFLPFSLEQIKKYLKTWQHLSVEETQVLYRNLFEAFAQMNDSQNALKFVSELLSTYTKETASKSRDDAHKCIVYCINDPNIFIFDNLLILEPIKYLEGELIHNLFTIFVSGKLHQYIEFYNSHKTLVNQFAMDHEKNINKMRLLNLMSLAETSKELPFDLLQKQLQIEQDEIESFVIDAIRTKCIRCKIDHLGKTVSVMSVSYRTFNKQHWQVLKERLEKWKENLASVDQNLTNLLSQQSLMQHA